MAKFLNKKEQVYDLRLTTYGRYLLSIGKFQPVYYEFFDDNILYDARYAMYTGSNAAVALREDQNEVFHRIKNETQYLESLVLFTEVENEIASMDHQIDDTESAAYSTDETPTQNVPGSDIYRFNSGIGDAMLQGDKQTAPAWKIVALNGMISSSSPSDTYSDITTIPQINFNLRYHKTTADRMLFPGPDEEQVDLRDSYGLETDLFSDNKIIKIVPDDPMIYAEEINTLLLTENFDVEVFERSIEEATNATTVITFHAADSDIHTETFTIFDGTNTVTFTFTTGTATASTQIDANYTSLFANAAMAYRAMAAINDYVDGGGALKVTAEQTKLNEVTITNDNGNGANTNTLASGIVFPRVTSSDEDKITTSGGVFTGGRDSKEVLTRKYFREEIEQVVDGMMITGAPPLASEEMINTGSVEYYFELTKDSMIDGREACRASEIFNRESYYVDLDFDCDSFMHETLQNTDIKYFDIYGHVTEPDICQD